MKRIAYQGNDWIGMFSKTNNEYTLVPIDSTKKFIESLEDNLKTKCIKTTIGETNLIGSYVAMNSNGIILPNITYGEEATLIKKETGLNVHINKDNHNANGNNIIVNDKGGIINPRVREKEKDKIQDVLGVELISKKISEYSTVGSNAIVNNKGFLLNYRIDEIELKEIEEILKIRGLRGTINLGTGFISIGALANDYGYIVGKKTTAYEMGRIEESLGYLDG